MKTCETVDSDKFTMADFIELDGPDIFAKAYKFAPFYTDWQDKGTCSYHRLITSLCANRTTIRDLISGDEREMVVLASNNYLGLNRRREVIEAAQAAVSRFGSGMCGSRFLSGTYDLVVELECQLADFEHREAAVVFTSGYQANVGTISALLRSNDIALIDRLAHASIVDGCRLSGAMFRTFRHNDISHLEDLLRRVESKYLGKLIVVDGVFSMDGDMAPLPEIVELAKRYGARVMVDEAHGTGVVGSTGRGSVEHFGVENDVDIILGTFSKTLSSTGGYIASSKAVVDYVRHYGRSYMFSASPTPATSASVLAALKIIRAEPGLREKLWANIRYFHSNLKLAGFDVFPDPPQSAIMTIIIGLDKTVRDMSKKLYERGLFANAIQYPAVPRNEGKIRISLSSILSRKDLDEALSVLTSVGVEMGIIGVG